MPKPIDPKEILKHIWSHRSKESAQRIRTFMHLSQKYTENFLISGNPSSAGNLLKLACFVNIQRPTEYESFAVDSEKTVIFYNK